MAAASSPVYCARYAVMWLPCGSSADIEGVQQHLEENLPTVIMMQ